MSLTVDDLTAIAMAAPHDPTKRKVLADAIDEHDPAGGAVSRAVRDDARGPAVLRTAWHEAQAKNLEPNYQLLWAVVAFDMDRAAAPQPVEVAPRRRRDEADELDEVGVPVDGTPDVSPWLPGPFGRRPDRRPWTTPQRPRVVPMTPYSGRRVAPLTAGDGRVVPLTVGDEFVVPLTTGATAERAERTRQARLREMFEAAARTAGKMGKRHESLVRL